FGGWAISGSGYGPTDNNESIKTLHAALDEGVNFIDTADSYGNGYGEELIGKILSERKDKNTIVATKFGWDFYNKNGIRSNLTPEYINFALNNSLKRIKRDWIDIYQIHSQNPTKIINNNVIETLEDIKQSGKIRYYGFSANYFSDALKIIKNYNIDIIQIPYNLINQSAAKEFFESIESNPVGIIGREPLASGFLTGKYSTNSVFPKTDHRNGYSYVYIKNILDKVEQLKFLEIKGRSLTQCAINFCLQNKKIGVVIPGVKNRQQLFENLKSFEFNLTNQQINQINTYSKNWI
ncbi:MAG: hypothetical protein GTO02_11220, partial [Candidatus Dadabacteria bacterium]|nr:hypothetical protein [Candidatus Dadabacteria bacterium]NIQ14931.1 hypothetical protein [Candidatus Dadabacteria bacterium]